MKTKRDTAADETTIDDFTNAQERTDERESESAARTGPSGDACTCLRKWIDAYYEGNANLLCFPCERARFRARDENRGGR